MFEEATPDQLKKLSEKINELRNNFAKVASRDWHREYSTSRDPIWGPQDALDAFDEAAEEIIRDGHAQR